MDMKTLAALCALQTEDGAVEIRTVDGHTYVADRAYADGNSMQDITCVRIEMKGLQSTYIAAEHIIVFNIVHEPKKVYSKVEAGEVRRGIEHLQV